MSMIKSTSLTKETLKFTGLVPQHWMMSFGLLVEEIRKDKYFRILKNTHKYNF